jgi:hypothetical protein
MSAREALQAALVAHLKAAAPTAVFDAPPVRGGLPYLLVDEPVLAANDAAGLLGRFGTVSVQGRDAGERPARLRLLVGLVEDVVEALPADLGAGGWRLGGLRLTRSRIARAKNNEWWAMSEFAVRVYRADS